MRLKLLLSDVDPKKFDAPKECPQAGCHGKRFYARQEVRKRIVDARHQEVTAWRYECLKCGHTFRVYPQMKLDAHSRSVKAMLRETQKPWSLNYRAYCKPGKITRWRQLA